MEPIVWGKAREEIIYEILVRLPVKSLLGCTAVCKSWSCMIKSPTFIHTHLINRLIESNHRNNDGVQLLLHNPEVELYSLYRDDDDPRASSSTLREYTDLDNPYKVYAERTRNQTWGSEFVGTCNGLVCLAGEDIYWTTLVWNPSIRKFVVLPKSGVTLCHGYDYREARSAFGYDRCANDYKVLRRVSCFQRVKVISCQYEIWSLAKGSWKTLNTGNDRHHHERDTRHPPAFVNGALHWVQVNVNTQNISIGSFDMSDEVFGKITTPPEAGTQKCFGSDPHCVVSRYRESLAFFESSEERRESGVFVDWLVVEKVVMKLCSN
ncbi:PREDICTED: F-box/kelch-repeat protein At3g23880-like [Prunus mume]|uniref:F-box/kelch-repeat protein At3g23880-like n=1 Tax=Prunus mume TaxID=102107 RepID=A0ABM1LSK8_PRUMU|nr:PREDICTED: F-box/kelch-repeat protein At3g23880-like [Prunus mume]